MLDERHRPPRQVADDGTPLEVSSAEATEAAPRP
jgi:hypothetical protein